MQKASALLLALCVVPVFSWPANLHASPVPLTNVHLDIDGDGRSDSVTVSIDGRVAVRRADGFSEALSFSSLPPLSKAFVELWSGKAGARYLRIEGRPTSGGRLLLLAALQGGRLVEIHNGPVGPVGRDAEYSVEVKLENGELLRYQTAPSVRRCDGETRLFIERYVGDAGFAPAPELLLPQLEGVPLATVTAGPAELKSAPLGIYRYVAASAQAGINRADMLTPPRELLDGNRGTAWRVSGDPRGAFVSAQSDGSGHSVRALRIETAAPNQGVPPQQLVLFFDDKQRRRVDLSPTSASGAQWVIFPEPVPCRCLSVAIFDGANKPGKAMVALSELAIYSELDGAAGSKSLVDRVARGNSTDAATAARTLQELFRQNPPIGAEVIDAAASLLSASSSAGGLAVDNRRRLEELVLSIADSPALGEAPRSRASELILSGLKQLSQSDRTARLTSLSRAGKFGESVLSRLVSDEKLLPEQRAEALLLLRCLSASHPTLVQTQATIARSLSGDEAALAVAAALINALTGAQAGCPDAASRSQLVESLVALWPQLPTAAATSKLGPALFVVRYRLLLGLERLATSTPGVVALLPKIVAEDSEPVLRQTAARALVALHSEARGLGLADRDAGVRLATLAALQAGMQGQDAALLPAIEERLVSDGWPQVRRVAAEVRAAACLPKPVVPAPQIASLRKALADSDAEVQRLALLGITRCEGAGALDVLLRVAEGKEGQGGGASLRGLGCALVARYGFTAAGLDAPTRTRAHKATKAALRDLFADPSADERSAGPLTQCMRGLGEAGDASDLPGLIDVASSDIPAPLRLVALRSVTAICGRGPVAASSKKGLAALFKAAQGDPDSKLQAEAKRAQALCKERQL